MGVENSLTYVISLLTILVHIAILSSIVLVAVNLFSRRNAFHGRIFYLIRKFWLEIALVIVFAGTAGSLYFSEILGFPPCDLCWYQRIFLYPQLIIIGAYYVQKMSKDQNNKRILAQYLLPFNMIGIIISGYHLLIQLTPEISCGIGEVSCNLIYFIHFGYITIPFMAFTAFIVLLMFNLLELCSPKTRKL